MPRRVGLPGASELFRSTAAELNEAADAHRAQRAAPARRPRGEGPAPHDELRAAPAAPQPAEDPAPRRRRAEASGPLEHTGRVRHDEKITVYVSSEELLALERLRLELRAEHGLAVDRGRIVRAAIASALAAIEAEGESADVVRRLAAP